MLLMERSSVLGCSNVFHDIPEHNIKFLKFEHSAYKFRRHHENRRGYAFNVNGTFAYSLRIFCQTAGCLAGIAHLLAYALHEALIVSLF